MRPGAALAALTLILAACTPLSGRGLPREALNENIARAIGGPGTCVLLVDRASGRTVYRYGAHDPCNRRLPACDRPGEIKVGDTLDMLADGPRAASCRSGPGRSVGWAAGEAPGSRPLNYAAVMEGSRTLPGREIRTRLESALERSGL